MNEQEQAVFNELTNRDGVEHIALARHKQVKKHKRTVKLDQINSQEQELVHAASAYIMAAQDAPKSGSVEWPWPYGYKPRVDDSVTERVKELAKAGALIAAEIDRLIADEKDRLESEEEA